MSARAPPTAYNRPMVHVKRLVLAVALVLPSVGVAHADASADRVAPLFKQAHTDASSPAGLVALQKMYELKGTLDELQPLAEAFEAIAVKRRALPEGAGLARFYDADI